MRARTFPLLLLTLPILLGGCESARQPIAAAVPVVKTTAPTASGRLAEIKAQIAKVCPVKMTPDELERAAVVVDRYSADKDVVAIVGRLFRFDSETRVCRGVA